jgi:hypothetical protein
MADSTPFALSQMFTNLIDRHVAVMDASQRDATKCRKACAVYDVVDLGQQVFLQIDMDLLGSLGGVLAGMPDAVVKQNLKANPIEETLRDAMHELLNITAAVIPCEGRAVLKKMELDEAKGRALAKEFTSIPLIESRFAATVPNYTGGQIALFMPIA